jgi:tetratricopeptide (TPR) repeat protein
MAMDQSSVAQFLVSRAGVGLCVFVLIATLFAHGHAAAQDNFKPLVQQAFELHQHGQFSAALPLLRRAYAMQPDDYFVNLLLGIDLLRTGDAEASVLYLKKASRLRPHEEFPLAYLGEAYALQKIFGEAAAAYMKAVSVAPTSAESSIAFVDFALSRFANISTSLRSSTKGLAAEYRLRALAVGEDGAERVSLLQRSSDLDPAEPGIWSDLGRASLAAGNVAAAEDAARRAVEANPNDLAAWMLDAQLAAQSRDWKRVQTRLNAIAQRSAETLSLETAQWPKQSQAPAGAVSGVAAKFLSCAQEGKVCELPPNHSQSGNPVALFREQRWEQLTKLPAPPDGQNKAWVERGIAFASLDDCARAIPSLERGLTASSTDTYALFQLSRCYSQQAGRIAHQVQQSADSEAPLHTMRGDILLRLQAKPELAVAEYLQALTLDPNDPAILERLAEAQFGAGKTEDARSSAQAALKIDPQRVGAKRTLAKIAIQERDYPAALPYLRELATRNPQDVIGKVELGKACAQTGALDEAFHNLAPALEHGYPDEKGALHYLLGTVLKKMGRTKDAEQAFATAAQLSDAFQHKSYHDQDPDAQP